MTTTPTPLSDCLETTGPGRHYLRKERRGGGTCADPNLSIRIRSNLRRQVLVSDDALLSSIFERMMTALGVGEAFQTPFQSDLTSRHDLSHFQQKQKKYPPWFGAAFSFENPSRIPPTQGWRGYRRHSIPPSTEYRIRSARYTIPSHLTHDREQKERKEEKKKSWSRGPGVLT